MCTYRRDFEESKYMPFLIKNEELLEIYSNIWDNVSNSIKKRFYCEPLYNEKYLKTKIKSYDGNLNTKFYSDKIPKKVLNASVY